MPGFDNPDSPVRSGETNCITAPKVKVLQIQHIIATLPGNLPFPLERGLYQTAMSLCEFPRGVPEMSRAEGMACRAQATSGRQLISRPRGVECVLNPVEIIVLSGHICYCSWWHAIMEGICLGGQHQQSSLVFLSQVFPRAKTTPHLTQVFPKHYYLKSQ